MVVAGRAVPSGRIGVGLVAAASMILGSSAASAGWQWTDWGMTEAQVRSASGGAAVPNANRGEDAGDIRASLAAPFRAAGISTTAYFGFLPDSTLTLVRLVPTQSSDCSSLLGLLKNAYGIPEEVSDGEYLDITRWRDELNGNIVLFMTVVEDDCSVQYRAAAAPGSAGGL